MAELRDLDDDGYPTEEALQRIRTWTSDRKFSALMEYVKSIWRYDSWDETTEEEKKVYHISTMGWSGNESIISALQDNLFFWHVCWFSSQRGGHYVFKVTEKP